MHLRALTAAFVAAASIIVGSAAPSQAEEAVDYVALGDSFSAGSGIWPLDPSVTPLCARSTSNYPNVVAAAISPASFRDVTCGGAQTGDFYAAQYPGVPAQLDAITADTDLVTLTIGGNDNDVFAGSIAQCGALGALTFGMGSPCKDVYGDSFERKVRDVTAPAVRKALADIHARAPKAEVVILGYPWLLPPTTGCFPIMPVARGDVPYLRSLQTTLNQVIARAAEETRSTFVDLSVVSEGHDACQRAGVKWVEPALFGSNFVPIHPNALGESQMALQALAAIKR